MKDHDIILQFQLLDGFGVIFWVEDTWTAGVEGWGDGRLGAHTRHTGTMGCDTSRRRTPGGRGGQRQRDGVGVGGSGGVYDSQSQALRALIVELSHVPTHPGIYISCWLVFCLIALACSPGTTVGPPNRGARCEGSHRANDCLWTLATWAKGPVLGFDVYTVDSAAPVGRQA